MSEWITMKETVQKWGLTDQERGSLYERVRRGAIKTSKNDAGKTLFSRDDINKYIDARRKKFEYIKKKIQPKPKRPIVSMVLDTPMGESVTTIPSTKHKPMALLFGSSEQIKELLSQVLS